MPFLVASRADLTHYDASCRNVFTIQFRNPRKHEPSSAPYFDLHVASFGHFQEAEMLFTSIERYQRSILMVFS